MEQNQYSCKHNPARRDLLFPDMRMKYLINLFVCSSLTVLCNIGGFIEFHRHWQKLQHDIYWYDLWTHQPR